MKRTLTILVLCALTSLSLGCAAGRELKRVETPGAPVSMLMPSESQLRVVPVYSNQHMVFRVDEGPRITYALGYLKGDFGKLSDDELDAQLMQVAIYIAARYQATDMTFGGNHPEGSRRGLRVHFEGCKILEYQNAESVLSISYADDRFVCALIQYNSVICDRHYAESVLDTLEIEAGENFSKAIDAASLPQDTRIAKLFNFK